MFFWGDDGDARRAGRKNYVISESTMSIPCLLVYLHQVRLGLFFLS